MFPLTSIQGGNYSDQELLEKYRSTQDTAVLGVLYERYMHLVYGACLKYLKDAETSKDAVMNIFEELVVKLKTHRVDNFRSWLFVVSKNHCLMHLRREGKIKTTEIPEAVMQSEDDAHLNGVMEKEKHLVALEECLDKLPAEQQRMVRMFYLENRCYNDIADSTGMEWNRIRSHIQNGRRNLKICMDSKTSSV
jgi:RNA polymerase sigma-70 factor (ECF subfamily)